MDLTVPYHKQDTDFYCSAACAQMILNTIGAGLLDQDELYNDIHDNSTAEPGWAGAPDGLQLTMNNRKPAALAKIFELAALGSADLISRKIAWTIQNYRVAPIALVFHAQHWIVVRGFNATAAPTGPNDTAYNIIGFYVNDPYPTGTLRTIPPPPHSNGDRCRKYKEEYVSLAQWQSIYMTGVNVGTMWLNKYVAICDPDIPSKYDGGEHPDAAAVQHSSDPLLRTDDAVIRAKEGLVACGLAQREDYKKAIDNTTPGDPVLVQRLDRTDGFYYIVPMLMAPGITPLAVLVDARSGQLLQSAVGEVPDIDSVPPEEADSVFTLISRPDAAALVIGKKVDLPGEAGRMRIRAEAVCQYPTLVWKPCRESLSPLVPFYMFTVGAHSIYVRIDGAIFMSLDDSGRGF